MVNGLWILVAFSQVLCVGPSVAVARRRRAVSRKTRSATFVRPHGGTPNGGYLAPDIAAAERQLGLLLRRMRIYQQAPYDFARSRIPNDTEFERCLDLATSLGLRIQDLCGASTAEAIERERVRDQILESLSRSPACS